MLAALSCSSSSGGGGSKYACHYTSSVQTVCNGYSDYNEDPGCIQVSSQSECNDYTKSSTDCTGGCCTDTSYVDVKMVAGSCSSTSGTGGSGGGGGGGGGGGSVCDSASGDTACTTCFKSLCCASFSACNASQDCMNLVNCIGPCASGDTACVQSCENSYPNGVTPLNDFGNCLNTSCSTQCN